MTLFKTVPRDKKYDYPMENYIKQDFGMKIFCLPTDKYVVYQCQPLSNMIMNIIIGRCSAKNNIKMLYKLKFIVGVR